LPERIFIGGVELGEWDSEKGPRIVASLYEGTAEFPNPLYIHADKHAFAWDNSGAFPVLFIGCDGGVFKSTNLQVTQFKPLNVGLNITQYYGIAANTLGYLVGGTQDNGTILIDGKGSSNKSGIEVQGGDGFRAEFSQYHPEYLITETYNGGMRRSSNAGSSIGVFFDNRIPRKATSNGSETNPNGGFLFSPFNTAIKLWEKDANKSRLFVGVNDGVWLCEDVFTRTADAMPDKDRMDLVLDLPLEFTHVCSMTRELSLVPYELGRSIAFGKQISPKQICKHFGIVPVGLLS